MRDNLVIVGLCSLAHFCAAHFTAGHLFINQTDTGLWKHVLEVASSGANNLGQRPDNHYPLTIPQHNDALYESNITCGRLAFDSLNKTEIADITAGEEVGFGLMTRDEERNWFPGSGTFVHPGPAQIYLSRAPNDDLKSYHGDGDWFKIAWAAPANNTNWYLYEKSSYNFTIPSTTPPGKYLMRFEYLWPSALMNNTQWYINCALVNINGPGGGTPTDFAKFPGTYKRDDVGIWIPWNQDFDRLPAELMRLLDYIPPGPPLWKG